MSDGLKIIHFNTQGFQNKLTGINNFVNVHKPDILVITEHFQKHVNDLERINGYKIVNSFCRKHNERGGVAIWAKDNISCKPRKDLDRHRKEKEFELVSVSVGEDVVVTGAYRPPSTSIPDFHVHLGRFIKKINKEPHIKHILTGDFNIDNSKPNKTRKVLTENDLMFHITKETHRKGSCIDNFITNFDSAKSRVIKSKISNISDHHPIEIIVEKEATLIAKKPDSFLYKLFRKMFEKKAAELKIQSEKKSTPESSTSQSVLYDMFSNMFDNRTSSTDPKQNLSLDKIQQKSYQRKDGPSELKRSEDISFFSKIFSFLNPWHTAPVEPETPVKSSGRPKDRVREIETAVTTTSFFSKIVKIISYAIHLFKQEPDSSPESITPNYSKTKKQRKAGSEESSVENSKPYIYHFFSKIFQNH